MSSVELDAPVDVHHLYSDHHSWLYNWLRRRVGCSHNAADLAQDTYVRLLTSGRTPNHGQARPYLLQIAKGLLIDRHRRSVIEKAYLDALSGQPESWAPSPEETTLVIEALVRIDSALSQLKPVVRETFLLSRFERLTYREIAQELGIAVATVRKYMLVAIHACMAVADDSEDRLHG